MNTFLVLMSVFNCEEYICSQLDSILNQKDIDVNILIRNNGSTDNTSSVLKEYCEVNPAVTFFDGKRCSEDAAYFRLFEVAEGIYDYYAIIKPYEQLHENYFANVCSKLSSENRNELPMLYCCPYSAASSENMTVYRTHKNVDTVISKENILLNDLSSITAFAFNNTLFSSIKIPMPNGLTNTGHWISIVAALFGKIVYDTTSDMISTIDITRPKRFSKEVINNLCEALNRTYKLPDEMQGIIDIYKNADKSFRNKLKYHFYTTIKTTRL